MPGPLLQTVDPASTRPSSPDQPREAHAVVEILFHSNLGRIGEMVDLGRVSAPSDARPMAIGRDEPLFAHPGTAESALLDPCISRRQVAVRWSPERGMFVVSPEPEGRRAVRLLDLSGVDLGPPPAEVEPGTLIAIGDRVLLLLTVRPARTTTDDLGLVGNSGEMAALRHRIAALADMTDTVLVRGETGVGKELVARALHLRSARRERPFLALNCAALPEALIESELFGYVKGAFSGAAASKPGMFAAAHGGTLLLDEIGEMPLGTQAKLLRVLELRRVRPIGAQNEEPIDVRIVAATNRDLAHEVAAGRFRSDLYSRIEAPLISVPPLSRRREDIPLLFSRFLRRRSIEHVRQAGRSVQDTPFGALWRDADAYPPAITLGQVLWLMRHDWPRNVREIDKVTAEVAASLLQGSPVPVPSAELAAPAVRVVAHAAPAALAAPFTSEADAPSRQRPDRIELERTLEAYAFNQTEVARALAVPYATLDRWLRELGIIRPRDLSATDIDAARGQCAGDLASMARLLRVSVRGLKARINELGLG
jgi:two-component system, NtrC family, nitrogen regulation response regulator GlnG